MSGDDPARTLGESIEMAVVDLDAVGFEDATEVGRGSFGVVYRCVQEPLDRMVAVKVLAAEFDENNRAGFAPGATRNGPVDRTSEYRHCPGEGRHPPGGAPIW